MVRKNNGGSKRVYNRGAWIAEEDKQLSQYIEIHGAKKWRTLATKSGSNWCRKSCRPRWLNYLRPNIKRGNISDDEEDLILRLHKLLGNRWSLIAGRLPGRTDNEIKNYWNSHLSKKMNQKEETTATSTTQDTSNQGGVERAEVDKEGIKESGDVDFSIDVDKFFNFSNEGTYGLEWVNKFLELDQDPYKPPPQD